MQGYMLPATLALLLAIPMLWRLEIGVALPKPGDQALQADLLAPEWADKEAETDPNVRLISAPEPGESGLEDSAVSMDLLTTETR